MSNYSLSVVDHILAIRKNAYGSRWQVKDVTPEFYCVRDFGVVVAQESSTDVCSWLLKSPNLNKRTA